MFVHLLFIHLLEAREATSILARKCNHKGHNEGTKNTRDFLHYYLVLLLPNFCTIGRKARQVLVFLNGDKMHHVEMQIPVCT